MTEPSKPEPPAPRLSHRIIMDALSLFGLFAILFMLLCYLMEERSPWWTFGFAIGCLLSSTYGFLPVSYTHLTLPTILRV